jgi:glycosyltransferase involved in cell wall biosynthesis
MSHVSACILSYNRAEYLCAAIDSILQQTVRPAEILVFDNGSDAMVYERVRPYLDRGVTWIGADINRSAVWNFRRAIAAAKSEYVFVLHDDDRLCNDFIERQINFLSQNPDVGAVTCNGYLINELGSRTGRLLRHDARKDGVEFYRSPAAVAIRYASESCLPFSPVVYRTEFVRAGNLREEFGKVVDAVFFCDLAKVGALAYQLRPLYECRVHGAQDSSYFSVVELDRLTDYFEDEAAGSAAERKELARKLTRQHTSRQLIRIYRSIFPTPRVSRLLTELRGLAHRRYSFFAAILICAEALRKSMSIKKV